MLSSPTSSSGRTCLVFSIIFAAMLLIFATLASFSRPSLGFPGSPSLTYQGPTTNSLASLALQKVLEDAKPIFGDPSTLLKTTTSEPETATWMKDYHDATKIVHMNLPGTHDAATWNYSQTTQNAEKYINDLANITATISPPAYYKCQTRSIIQMLNAGIRVFDLRYAFDVTRSTLVFWHGDALQSETATVEDVLYAFYAWLDQHPSEAVFLSFQHEYGPNDAETQLALYNTFTSSAATAYIVQAHGQLDTLGDARGKITLLKRFDLDLLPSSYEDSLPGLHFSPQLWIDDGSNTTLIYNSTSGATAYIEDYYYPSTLNGSSASENIQWKLNATTAHLDRAASDAHKDSLFWGFASSTKTDNVPPDTPEILALGNGTLTPKGGVNQQLVPVLKGMKGKRLGIMMFDFFEEPEELVPLYLNLLKPAEAREYGL